MRRGLLPAAAPLAAVLLASVPPAREATAQSVDDCMEASPAEALSLCRTLIDEQRDNADVWAQFALSLDKSGRGADARAAVDEALQRYPRDADLLALRDLLAASGSEQERLEQAARRNESAVAQGELKLLCRIRQGVTAIEACRRYLAMTDVDGERIRARLAELEQALPSVAEAPVPDPRPSREPSPEPAPGPRVEFSPDSPSDGPPVESSSDSPSEPRTPRQADAEVPSVDPADTTLVRVDDPSPSAPDPDATRRRERIVSIQRALDALGLPVGAPDGIAGTRTREALARFDALTGRPASALDDTTLRALEAERSRLEAAEATLETSRAAARAGRFDEALELLARAESGSALLRVPPDYRSGLERDRRQALEAARTAEEARRRAETKPRDEAGTPTGSDAPGVSATLASGDALAELLVRIGMLERRLAEASEVQRRDAARVREQVRRALLDP